MSRSFALLPAALLLFSSFTVRPKKLSHNAICLFSTSAANPALVREQAMLDADIPGLSARDLLVTVITPASDPELYKKTVTGGADFTLLLVDGEGRTKFKCAKPVRSEVLYAIIDKGGNGKAPANRLENPDSRQ